MKVYFKLSTSYNRLSRKYKLKFWSKYYTLGGLQTLAHSFLEKKKCEILLPKTHEA